MLAWKWPALFSHTLQISHAVCGLAAFALVVLTTFSAPEGYRLFGRILSA
jgi:hypothetical protein